MDSLYELLNRELQFTDAGRDGFFDIPSNYAAPGFWSAYVARAKSRNLNLKSFKYQRLFLIMRLQ